VTVRSLILLLEKVSYGLIDLLRRWDLIADNFKFGASDAGKHAISATWRCRNYAGKVRLNYLHALNHAARLGHQIPSVPPSTNAALSNLSPRPAGPN
jgi:hypothetical protein